MDKIRIFNSLRVKLGIFAVVLIAIPVLVISFTYSRTVKEIIRNKYTETAIQSVFETGEKLDFILDDVQEFSTLIISNSELLDMLDSRYDYRTDEFGRVLRNFFTSRDDIEVIDLVLDDAYYTVGAKKINRLERINQRLSESSGQPIWFPTKAEEIEILSGKFRKNYFTLARKIVDFNTLKTHGYLLIDLEEVLLEQAYSGLLDNEHVEVLICDDQGVIISHTEKERIGGSVSEEPYGAAVLADADGHNYVQYKTDIDKVAIYSTIRNNGWKIIKTVPTDYLYEELNHIQKYFVVGGAIYCLVIILYILLFSIRFTEPMMKMMTVIKKVEHGDLTVRTEVKTNDEVGQLGNSLNNMIGEMQVLIDQHIREEQEKKEVELEALHAQINPHFLYNTLNTIKWMAKIQGNSGVSKAITALVKLLRISTNLGRGMISLNEEIDYVTNYLVIQKLRFSKAINLSCNIGEECMGLNVPKLILQPIVENSIIHGMEDDDKDMNIVINGYENEGRLIIEVLDDGPGIADEIMKDILSSPSDRNKFSKVGLNNVNQRIKLYCGAEYGLNIETKLGAGTKVIVTLPVIPAQLENV